MLPFTTFTTITAPGRPDAALRGSKEEEEDEQEGEEEKEEEYW